ncbi:peptide/nickel transport system substrate-binding protein [Kibdelosporangium banguiense]|uniref:Peptide/nickel transport system substrate-binding protein n=1 Tax=Kibdelosporangium banguiense TaxID=1365924 RepID=A0ABS4U2W5_9PSEU|nr:ABC transporter substrate-binding protein [Kibdelosporangium banguiense]MBP2331009.1 peptide/nickel transport system substrate-binding protein [Kibdelosporangium banguiense]
MPGSAWARSALPVSPALLDRRAFLRGLGIGAIGLTACAPGGAATSGPGEPRRGGRLRAVVSGTSSSADTLHPFVAGSWGAGIVLKNVFDKLCAYNDDLTVRMRLAESIEPNADGSMWTIRLRDGVQWHNGKPLSADDLVYSIRYLLDPANTFSGAQDLSMVDSAGVTKVDQRTVRVPMRTPIADLPSLLAGWYNYVIPEGTTKFDNENPPVGTGPFKFVKWSPGDRVLLARNDAYWENGRPYLDELEVIFVTQPDTRLNALLGGQADVAHELAWAQAAAQQRSGQIQLTVSPAGRMQSFNMMVTAEPFTDPAVREALKLSVDRREIVDTVYAGYADVGNDLYGLGAPLYASDLPQRAYDPDRARSLLRAAGKEGLSVTLHTSDVTPGMLQAATLYAEQVKRAGITINLQQVPADSYWSTAWAKQPFTQSGWGNYALDWFYGQTVLSSAESNETAWRRPDWDQRYFQARATMDPGLRAQRYGELQRELWTDGGYIIHSFVKWIDGAHPRVGGLRGAPPASDGWGNYREIWLGQ